MDERGATEDVAMTRADESSARALDARHPELPVTSGPEGTISPARAEAQPTSTDGLHPVQADASSLTTRRILVRATAVPADKSPPTSRQRHQTKRPIAPLTGDEGPARVDQRVGVAAPLLVSDLRPAVLAPLAHRLAAWLAGIHRAVVSLGVRSLGHPIAIVLYAMVVGTLLRSFRIGTNPPGLNQDEAVAGYDAWSLWLTLRDHHGNTLPIAGFLSFGDWVSPFLSFYLAPIVGIFGLDVTTVRAGTVLLGIAAIPFTYLVTVELTGRRGTGAAAACFLAISPWAVHLSRFAIPPATVVPLLALALWLGLRALRLTTLPSMTLAGAGTALLVLGYPTMKLYVPLLAVLVLVLYGRSIVALPVRALVAGILVFAVIAGPSYLFFFRDPAAQNRQQYVSIFNRPEFSPGMLAENYWGYLSPNFLFERARVNDYIKGEPFNAEPGYGVELAWIAPFLVVGLLAVLARALDPRLAPIARRPALLLLGALLLAPVTGAVTYDMNSSRNAQMALLVAVVAGIGLVSLFDVSRGLSGRIGLAWRQTGLSVALIALLTVPIGVEARSQYRGYFNEWPKTEPAEYFFHAGLLDAIQYASSVEDDYDEIWITAANQGYIFLLFGQRIDPVFVHEMLRTTTSDFNGYHVEQFGKYHFTRPYQGPPDDLHANDMPIVHESFVSDTGRGYVVREGIGQNGQRVLVIQDRVRE